MKLKLKRGLLYSNAKLLIKSEQETKVRTSAPTCLLSTTGVRGRSDETPSPASDHPCETQTLSRAGLPDNLAHLYCGEGKPCCGASHTQAVSEVTRTVQSVQKLVCFVSFLKTCLTTVRFKKKKKSDRPLILSVRGTVTDTTGRLWPECNSLVPVCWPCPPVCSHRLGRHRKQLSPGSDCRTMSPEGRKRRAGWDSPGFLPRRKVHFPNQRKKMPALDGRGTWSLWFTATEARPGIFCGDLPTALCQGLHCPGAELRARVGV